MSLRFRDGSGDETIIAGLTPGGDIEAGAVAEVRGTISIPETAQDVESYVVVVFPNSFEMPSDDYLVTFDEGNTTAFNYNISNKTTTGFRLAYRNTYPGIAGASEINYICTKTYTVQHDAQNTQAIANIEAAMPSDAGINNKLATKAYVDNAESGLDSRLDDIEDVVPTSASITNKLVTKTELDNVQIDKLADIADVNVTGVQDGQTILWDDTDSEWKAGQAGKVYTAGDGIEISTLDKISVDDEYVPLTFVGTKAQWDELTVSQKAKYTLVDLTDDPATGAVVVTDTVAEGNMNPVTSNAVANYKNATYRDFEVNTYASVIGDWAPFKYYYSRNISLSGYKPVVTQLVAPSGNHGFAWFNNVNDGAYLALCEAPTSADPVILRVTYIKV